MPNKLMSFYQASTKWINITNIYCLLVTDQFGLLYFIYGNLYFNNRNPIGIF